VLAFAAPASADYEQVPEHFGVGGENPGFTGFKRALGAAVNETGAGGVEPGSFYVVGEGRVVLRYSPGGEGEGPQLREAWGWGVGNGGEEFQRCGPALPTEPAQGTFHTCLFPSNPGSGEQIGHFGLLKGVAVDQVTGYVYVANLPNTVRRHHLIEVFTPTGIPVGEGFGDAGIKSPPEAIDEGPGKLHSANFATAGGLAVDGAGTVYVNDEDFDGVEQREYRVMSFEPDQPGEYDHYVYAGRAKDIELPTPASRLALVGSDRLVVANPSTIREYAIGGDGIPICDLTVLTLLAMDANRMTGEVFYFSEGSDRRVHRLAACDETTGEFKEIQQPVKLSPETTGDYSLAVNARYSWGPLRAPGVVYAIDTREHGSEPGVGDVLAPAESFPPAVLSESVTNTDVTSSTLRAGIDSRGFATGFRFQYLSEAAYEANEPDERQALTVSATGGLLSLGFEGRHLGGAFTANLSNGSRLAEGLVTADGVADLRAASGTATLSGGVGKGTIIAGSKKVTAASASEGAFANGQTISGNGIPAGTTIVAVAGSELTLSAAATESEAGVVLTTGTTSLASVTATEGAFEVGQVIEGPGIPFNTTIDAVTGTELILSKPTEKPGTAVAVSAGSTTLTGVLATEGNFEPGTPISGEGIPSETTITAVHGGSVTISKAPTKPGSGVTVLSRGPAPLAAGETVEGPGIPPGTTIETAEAGKLTLSSPAEVTVAGVHLRAGVPFDAPASELQMALEGLATIGEGDVSVSGGPGDETGSSPYLVEFGGALTNQDLPQLEADASGLSGPATAQVATENDGGEGFASGASEAPAGGGNLPGGGIGTASTGISGLQPNTRYRFRVIAASECEGSGQPPCEAFGETASFRTYPSTPSSLPDGRAYELVSPAQKNGGEVFPAASGLSSCHPEECKPPGNLVSQAFPMQSAPGGDSVSYMGFQFSPNEGASVTDSYISRRTSAGWQTTVMSPSLLTGEPLAYDEGLEEGLTSQSTPALSPSAPVGYENVYRQRTSDPAAFSPLLSATPPNRAPSGFRLEYGGHSGDFSTQLFAANDALTAATAYAPQPSDPGVPGRDLYEWRGGQLALVNVLPGNAGVADGAVFASKSPESHGVSSDGSRIYWQAGGHLYVRENEEFTVEIHHPGSFLTASADGSQVLLSDGCLYSLESEACTDLTEGHGGFQGIAGIGEEGGQISHVYFIDAFALPGTGPSERGQAAQSGKNNLYAWSESDLSYVATLPSSDNAGGVALLADWAAEPSARTAEASPAGRWLAFGSTAELTGHGNVGPCGETSAGIVQLPCTEVFLYDSATGRLTCPSCNPTGEAPLGNSTLRRIQAPKSWHLQPRYLTDSGRLYFDSSDRLSPLDVNGGVEDVYEFEPAGVGDCQEQGGCVSLISPGSGAVDSNLLAVDETGKNVFFTSRERLVRSDTDELIDLYDAREGGGFPAETESQKAECQGESCQPSPNPPAASTPASSLFHGSGNVKPERVKKCPKGKVRKNGKCVNAKVKKHKKHGNHKRGGAN
jgi:hypothetical protein